MSTLIGTRRTTRYTGAVGLLAAAALTLTACGAGTQQAIDPSGAPGPAGSPGSAEALNLDVPEVQEIAAMVPDTLVEAGTLTFPITGLGVPLSSFDEGSEAGGLIPDLLTAVAATMGLEASPQRTQSDGTIPGLDAQRFDLTPETADLPTRRAEYLLVDYLKAGAALLTASGNPLGIEDKTDLCGLRVAVAKSSLQENMANEQSTACTEAGEDAIEITAIADSSLQLPITSGRADASWVSLAAGQYLAESQPDQFGVAGEEFLVDLAMMFRQNDAALAEAVKAALDELKDTGVYDEILAHYSQTGSALDEFTNNLPE